jgi:ankyrin repeat protein
MLSKAWYCSSAELEMLIERGADVNAIRTRGHEMWETPLHSIARGSGRPEHTAHKIELLLENGARVNAPDWRGLTPLEALVTGAGVYDPGEVASLLVRYGARLGYRDERGGTLLHVAAHYNRASVLQVLLDAGMDIEAPAALKSPFVTRGFVEEHHDSPLNRASSRQYTTVGARPLHYAANAGAIEAGMVLVRNGADRGAETEDGVTPLSLARARLDWLIEYNGSAAESSPQGDPVALEEFASRLA